MSQILTFDPVPVLAPVVKRILPQDALADAPELVLPVCPPQTRLVLLSWAVMISVMVVLLGTGMWLEY